jgi:aspartate/methionine/tyrosine aminotransferase
MALAAREGAALIIDEVFADYALDEADTVLAEPNQRFVSPPAEALCFAMSGLSKVAGLPGLKLSWIRAFGPPAQVAAALARLEVMGDTYLSVNTPVQGALSALLALGEGIQRDIAQRIQVNYRLLIDQVARHPAGELLHAEGGWYGVLRLPRVHTDEAWALLLLDVAEVLVQPGYLFDFSHEGCCVVSLLLEPKLFERAVGQLLGVVADQIAG